MTSDHVKKEFFCDAIKKSSTETGHILRQGYVAQKSMMACSEIKTVIRRENHHQFPNLQSVFAKSKWVLTNSSFYKKHQQAFSSLRDVPEFNNFIQNHVLPVWMSLFRRDQREQWRNIGITTYQLDFVRARRKVHVLYCDTKSFIFM